MIHSVKKVFLWQGALAVAALYVASFFAPAFGVSGVIVWGWEAFLCTIQILGKLLSGYGNGAMGDRKLEVLHALLQLITWLPNPLVWVGVGGLLAGRRHLPWVTGVTAMLCSLTPWVFWGPQNFLVGFYLWVASMGLLAAIGMRQVWRQSHPPGFVTDQTLTKDHHEHFGIENKGNDGALRSLLSRKELRE